jgi:hypothetical protein
MTTKINLLAILLLSLGIKAQNQSNMKNKMDSLETGYEVKHGKLLYSEIVINTTPENVWKVIMDFENYPTWNPFIKSIKGNPTVTKNIEVVIQPTSKKPMQFRPKVLVCNPHKEFRWIGKLVLKHIFDGEHIFILKDNNNGTTTFIQYERFRGILVPFLKRTLNTNTLSGYNNMNEALKKRCEN